MLAAVTAKTTEPAGRRSLLRDEVSTDSDLGLLLAISAVVEMEPALHKKSRLVEADYGDGV